MSEQDDDTTLIELTGYVLAGIWVLLYMVLGLQTYRICSLVVGTITIIIMYSIKYVYENKDDMMNVENYEYNPRATELKINNPTKHRFCNDERYTGEDQTYFSTNQSLTGRANPKTAIPPPVIAPPMASDYWSKDFVVPHAINNFTNYDAYRSGYIVTTECDKVVLPSAPIPKAPVTTDPNNFIPYNVPAGECDFRPEYAAYNKNLYTNTIQPGMYARTETVDPLQSNIGITFTPQYQPMIRNVDTQGVTYISKDKYPSTPVISTTQVVEPYFTADSSSSSRMSRGDIHLPPITPLNEIPTYSNVHDPRSFGYGTSYRGYVDPMTGQPRFMYDDIDAVRKPNFLVRSNIDHNNWAQTYDRIQPEKPNYNRDLAQQQYLKDSLQQREELQERYMHKVNNEVMWQRRLAPIHTRGMTNNSCRR